MNTIQIIELGVVEIYTYFEGRKFILERLHRGSIMNYRNLFLEDESMHVYAECLNSCYIFEIEENNLVSILSQNPKAQKKLLTYQNDLLKRNLVFCLDYVVQIPRDLMDSHYKPKGITVETFRRLTKVKNVVMRRVLEIRQEKAKPKLSDLLSEYMSKDKKEDPNLTESQREEIKRQRKEQLKRKLLANYENGKFEDLVDCD